MKITMRSMKNEWQKVKKKALGQNLDYTSLQIRAGPRRASWKMVFIFDPIIRLYSFVLTSLRPRPIGFNLKIIYIYIVISNLY